MAAVRPLAAKTEQSPLPGKAVTCWRR